MFQFVIVGANGRMGQEIVRLIKADSTCACLTVDPKGKADFSATHYLSPLAQKPIDALIDFTAPEVTMESADWCKRHNIPLVTGTTGLNEDQIKEIKGLSKLIPIVYAPNMSLGVNLIDIMLKTMGKVLTEFDVEIVEAHHRGKKDSPSGTAKLFANTLADVMERDIKYGRPAGIGEERDVNDIVVHALRAGSIPGSHDIIFAGEDEEIIVSHRAGSRKVFAKGALMAAKWIVGKPAKLYSMKHVLNI